MRRSLAFIMSAAAVILLLLHASTAQDSRNVNVTCPRAADIVLVVDQSASIVVNDPLYNNWYVRVLGFIKRIIGAFPISSDLTQVGLMKFSSGVEIVFHLNRYGNSRSMLNAVDNVDINGGQTNIAAALRTARNVMFTSGNGARGGTGKNRVPMILVLLTDGAANREADRTLDEARATKAAGIIIYTIGVTNQVDEDELRDIASKAEYFFFASDFSQLNNVLLYLVENSCKEAATLPTTTTTTTTPSTSTSTSTTTTTPTTTTTTTPTTTTTTTTTPSMTTSTTTLSTTTLTSTTTTTPTTTSTTTTPTTTTAPTTATTISTSTFTPTTTTSSTTTASTTTTTTTPTLNVRRFTVPAITTTIATTSIATAIVAPTAFITTTTPSTTTSKDDFPFIIVGATVGIALGLLVVAVVAVLVCKRLNVVRHKAAATKAEVNGNHQAVNGVNVEQVQAPSDDLSVT